MEAASAGTSMSCISLDDFCGVLSAWQTIQMLGRGSESEPRSDDRHLIGVRRRRLLKGTSF